MEVLKLVMIVVPWVLVASLMAWFCIKELHQLCLTKRLKSVVLVGIILYFFSPLWLWGIFSFISNETFTTFLIVWTVLCILILLFFSFYGAYSEGYKVGAKIGIGYAESSQHKTIEIRDTWPSHLCHAAQTIFLLSLVIFFFPWFIVYRFGKWNGRKNSLAWDRKMKEEDADRVRISEQEKYMHEYYDNPNDHTPNAYGYTGIDEQ